MSLIDLALKLAQHTPVVGEDVVAVANRVAINHFARSTPPRPRPYSLWSAAPADTGEPEYITDYTSWPALTNRAYSARHLPPADPGYIASLPQEVAYVPGANMPPGAVTSLFTRGERMTTSRSSLLFTFFAQ